MSVKSGIVFDIERFALEDGPGIRTLVFLKGCSLRCRWCANPESHSPKPDILYFQNNCRGCGRCILECPQAAIHNREPFGLVSDSSRCTACGKCVETCYYNARSCRGRIMSVDEVMAEVRKDKEFYQTSGGGVTFSGGEPFLQHSFLAALAGACHAEGINTAVETCGHVPWHMIEPVLPFLDLVFFDVKHSNSQKHLDFTGAGNDVILANLHKVNQNHTNIIIRVPYIPGFNDELQTIEEIFYLASGLEHVKQVEILPYHRFGYTKYQALGKTYQLSDLQPVRKEALSYLTDLGQKKGVRLFIGAEATIGGNENDRTKRNL